MISHPTTPVAPVPSSGIIWWHHLPKQVACLPQPGDEVVETSEELPHQKQKDGMPLKKLLKGGQQEAFAKDVDHFRTNCPDFDCEVLCDLSGFFQEMTTYVDLLDSEIYEIQEVWTGQEDLQYANDTVKSLPKGLWFFCPMSLSESPKVMGLKGIHHPDALCHFAQLTCCPWCGKEGQNEGTMANHLWTMHYKLELVCGRCLCFPSITSEAIWHHGQGCKQPRASDTKEEDGGPNNVSTSDSPAPTVPSSQNTLCYGGGNASTSRHSLFRTLILFQ